MEEIRQLVFYKNHFKDFFDAQKPKVQQKIEYVLFVLTHAERVPEKFLKHFECVKGLYEIRIEAGSNIFRIFCCFDKGKIIVLFNGFQKKKQKTPKQEIEKAIQIMDNYFNDEKK